MQPSCFQHSIHGYNLHQKQFIASLFCFFAFLIFIFEIQYFWSISSFGSFMESVREIFFLDYLCLQVGATSVFAPLWTKSKLISNQVSISAWILMSVWVTKFCPCSISTSVSLKSDFSIVLEFFVKKKKNLQYQCV